MAWRRGRGAAWIGWSLMISCSAIATGVGATAGWFAESSERNILRILRACFRS